MKTGPCWRRYHEATKHTPEKIRSSRHYLDWANMPDPFRHYKGAPVRDLPAVPPALDAPALAVLGGVRGRPAGADGPALLSQILLHSAAISATKVVPSSGHRYALRVNPSSGNLHPTEFHFATRGLAGWPDGLYHYRPSDHTAEHRATGDFTLGRGSLVFFLTTIAWREAWKYQSRAYRYCLLDLGHAVEALILACRAAGYHAQPDFAFDESWLGDRLRLAQDEWPLAIVAVADLPTGQLPAPEEVWHPGEPNRLSGEVVAYPLIDEIHHATSGVVEPFSPTGVPSGAPPAGFGDAPFGAVVRQRRSALDFVGGTRRLERARLEALAGCGFRERDLVTPFLFLHRVEDIEPGLYTHDLSLVRPGDQRVAAAGLSLGQDLAANSCVTFSLVADLGRATALHGERGYRYAFFEAGRIGQRLYLAAEALGFRSTGIGAFYDDAVHTYFGLDPAGPRQVVYHFASGYPVRDARISI